MFFSTKNIKKIAILLVSIWIIHPVLADATSKKIKSQHITKIHKAKKPTKPRVKKAAKKITTRQKKSIRVQKPSYLAKQSGKSSTIIHKKNIYPTVMPAYLLTSLEKNMVNFVRNTVEGIRYTTYKLGGAKIDTHAAFILSIVHDM